MRDGSVRATPRTQSAIAVSADGRRWLLCNASPDLHRQIAATPALQPRGAVRESPIAGVLLVDGQVDHAAGLLLLRESAAPIEVWSTEAVHEDLSSGFPLFGILGHYCGVHWNALALGAWHEMPALPGVRVRALAVDGKPGPYSPHRSAPRTGDNIALAFVDAASGAQLLYAPGLAAVAGPVAAALHESRCVLVDGSFWADDEMIRAGISEKRARDLGHLPQSGPGGLLEALARLPRSTRRILVHVNNTNPILDEDSAERAMLTAAGIEVGVDGMEIEL